ncbi:unnamed protein product [Rhodiola kirilowii]
MEDQRVTDMQQIFASFERLTKSMDDFQLKHNPPPDHRQGKQPMHENTAPQLHETPSPTLHGHSEVFQEHTGEPQNPYYGEHNQRPLRAPRVEVPIFHGEGVEGWLFQLNRYFNINNIHPDQMLEYAPLFLGGDALLWYQWKNTTGQISTWLGLAADIRRRFGPSAYHNAEVAINMLVQTSSAQAYITEFERMSMSAPKLVGSNLLSRFVAGLKEEIRHEITLLCPPDLDKAMGMARVIEDKLLALRRLTTRPTFNKPYQPTKPPYRPPSDTPRPNQNPLPFRRLTAAEIAARREKGLCFNCDEKFVPGHTCRPRFQCLLLEEPADAEDFELVEHEPVDRNDTQVPAEPVATPEANPCITFHALQGRTAPSTLRFQASICGQPVLILVDSGSTHNFIQTRAARFLKLAIEPANHLRVTVGVGDFRFIQCMTCIKPCKSVV